MRPSDDFAHDDEPVAFRWRVEGADLPEITKAVLIGRAARATVMRTMNDFGFDRLPDDFHHGREGGQSAYWLPDDEDGDGLIDHVLCIHTDGLPRNLLPAMASGGKLGLGDGRIWSLAPVWMGASGPGGLFGPARIWTSTTPYVTPLDVRRKPGKGSAVRPGRGIAEQIAGGLARLDLPAPISVETRTGTLVGNEFFAAHEFVIDAPGGPPPPRDPDAAFVRLVFREPVWGPLALGWGAHFGLGLFSPEG